MPARRCSTAVAAVLMVLLPSVGGTQTAPAPMDTSSPSPVFRTEVFVFADRAGAFVARVDRYSELRARLESALRPVVVTDNVRQIRHRVRSLAKAIRVARRGAIAGEFFTPAASAEIQRVLKDVMTATVWAVIMDDNPGAFRHDIDGDYPEGETRSTMPGIVLASLPQLPADIEFRFLGRHLILYDVRANTIIDRLPNAIACEHCGFRRRAAEPVPQPPVPLLSPPRSVGEFRR